MPPESDHDKIVRIDTSLEILVKQFNNHLKHHWAIDLALLVAVLGLITAIVRQSFLVPK